MNTKFLQTKSNQRFAIAVFVLSLVLAIQITVYAGKRFDGAEIATSCAQRYPGSPSRIPACVFGSCMGRYFGEPKKWLQCVKNANQHLKK